MGSVWVHFGVGLGSVWVKFGISLGHFGPTLVPLWGHVGITLGTLWGHFGISLGSVWDQCGNNLGAISDPSGHPSGDPSGHLSSAKAFANSGFPSPPAPLGPLPGPPATLLLWLGTLFVIFYNSCFINLRFCVSKTRASRFGSASNCFRIKNIIFV